jgi:hypothetical protein
MQPDESTVPTASWLAPARDHSAQELSPFADFPVQVDHPTWPALPMRPESRTAPRRVASGSVSALAFGISLGVNAVLLVALLGVLTLVLNHADQFLPGGDSGLPGAGLVQRTATATASPTSSAGWLLLTPSSVQLGCANGQQTQYVILQNIGPTAVRWTVSFSLPTDQAGVTVSPYRGTLAAGASLPLRVQNTTSTSDQQAVAGQQGTISFSPTTADAGSPATLSYTTVACS